jgi:hypothetical protein
LSDLTHPDCPRTKAAVIDGSYREGCASCLNTITHGADYSNKYRRERSKEDHRADIVQRYDGERVNPEWVRLYEAKARQEFGDQFVEDLLRK